MVLQDPISFCRQRLWIASISFAQDFARSALARARDGRPQLCVGGVEDLLGMFSFKEPPSTPKPRTPKPKTLNPKP